MALGNFKRQFQLTKYRMKIRDALKTCDREQLQINLEETKKEIERRNKK